MVEVMEYLLVFGVTTALAGFSVIVLGGSLPALHQTQGQAELDQLVGAASIAAEEGNATVVLSFDNASVSCSHSTVELSTGGTTYSSRISAACQFDVTGLDGVRTLTFLRGPAGLELEAQS